MFYGILVPSSIEVLAIMRDDPKEKRISEKGQAVSASSGPLEANRHTAIRMATNPMKGGLRWLKRSFTGKPSQGNFGRRRCEDPTLRVDGAEVVSCF
jgi:hypothetical protein